MVGSGRSSNSFEILWLSLLSARMKTIQSKGKALEWPKHYMLNILPSRAANSVASGEIGP